VGVIADLLVAEKYAFNCVHPATPICVALPPCAQWEYLEMCCKSACLERDCGKSWTLNLFMVPISLDHEVM